MSQRPRLGDDGRLTGADVIQVNDRGEVIGQLARHTVDPFEWTTDRLLLAESFARLDLTDRQAVGQWWGHHGALNVLSFDTGIVRAKPHLGQQPQRVEPLFGDYLSEAAIEQANVAWHLATLTRLSDERDTQRWDQAWGEFVLATEGEAYLVGGVDAGAKVPSSATSTSEAVAEEAVTDQDGELRRLADEAVRRPTVWVHRWGWLPYWGRHTAYGLKFVSKPDEMRRLGADWESMLEVEERLMAPYVGVAAERQLRTTLEARSDGRRVIALHEDRVWISVLAPIYLQLFEALRRISEGQPGAATCRECGRPFLILDARRRFFCNERERYRYMQRAHRRRVAASKAEASRS